MGCVFLLYTCFLAEFIVISCELVVTKRKIGLAVRGMVFCVDKSDVDGASEIITQSRIDGSEMLLWL